MRWSLSKQRSINGLDPRKKVPSHLAKGLEIGAHSGAKELLMNGSLVLPAATVIAVVMTAVVVKIIWLDRPGIKRLSTKAT